MNDTKERKKQINIRLAPELYDFLAKYAKENYKTVTGVLREIIAKLYKEHMEKKPPLVVKGDE